MRIQKPPVGSVFVRLTVVGDAPPKIKRYERVMCVCSCGRRRAVRVASLVSGITKSCGCLVPDTMRKRSTSHGMSATPTYQTWRAMIRRCHEATEPSFARYGARGIKVCERWRRFEAFVEDMGHKPEGLSLDRIDNNGDYAPHNCRWATPKQQQRNRRCTSKLSVAGETKSAAEWAERTGIPVGAIRNRMKAGWDANRIISTPVPPHYIARRKCNRENASRQNLA